jgi:hypothetical protein
MSNRIVLYIFVLIHLVACKPNRKMQLYDRLKNEITKEVFNDFEKYLPESYDNSIMATIRYAPSYVSLGCSGLDVLFELSDQEFEKHTLNLYELNKIPTELFIDSSNIDCSNSEYYSFFYNNEKIAIPRLKDDFCRKNDTCFSWNDIEVLILDIGKQKTFTKNVPTVYQPENPICSYSIGALLSKQKQHIIYWLFIYE